MSDDSKKAYVNNALGVAAHFALSRVGTSGEGHNGKPAIIVSDCLRTPTKPVVASSFAFAF